MSENETRQVGRGQIVISDRVYVPILALIAGAAGAYAVVKFTAPPQPPFDDAYRAAYYRTAPPPAAPSYYPTPAAPPAGQAPLAPSAAAPVLPPPQQAVAPTQPPAPVIQTYTTDPAVSKEVSERIIPALLSLDGIMTPGPNGDTTDPILIVYDPHCPYCHKAFAALRGKAPIKWIPVAILADPDDAIAQANAVLDEERKAPGSGGDAMQKAFDHQLTYSREVPQPAKDSFNKNVMSFVALYTGRDPRSAGVPTVLVPRKDGSLYFSIGFQPGDDVKLLGLYRN